MSLRNLLAVAAIGAALAAPAWAQSPYRADLDKKWFDNGQLRWPPNDGCASAEVAATLKPGTRIDRYGSENGTYFATPGISFGQRALPYDPTKLPYTVYVVKQPMPVLECKIAAWFDEPGGGEQYKAAQSAAQLKASGIIAGP